MEIKTRELQRMGTVIQLTVQHYNADLVLDELVLRLERYEKRFSAHDPTSELMEINRNAGIKPVETHPQLYELIKIGKKHSIADNSSLNIAIGPLVNAWRIGFKDARVPSRDTIRSLLKLTDARNIILDAEKQTVFLKKAGMFIDLGALAKGYIADRMVEDLEAMNVFAGIVNLGGNVVTFGKSPKHPDGYWRIGIQHPLKPRGNYIAVLKTLNQSVVTSGVYERKFTIGDKNYHHILDPETGYPIDTQVAGLTIVSDQSIDGEIWTGRLFHESPENIIAILEKLEGITVIVVTKEGELHYSISLSPYLETIL